MMGRVLWRMPSTQLIVEIDVSDFNFAAADCPALDRESHDCVK